MRRPALLLPVRRGRSPARVRSWSFSLEREALLNEGREKFALGAPLSANITETPAPSEFTEQGDR